MSQQVNIERLTAMLHERQCSLVVCDTGGTVTCHDRKGVRDLIDLLDNAPARLKGAVLADKVVGKAAAGLMVNGGVREVYADVMSRLALPLLEQAGIARSWGLLVDRIVIPEGDTRCPLESIVAQAGDARQVEVLLRQHFDEMRRNKLLTQNNPKR